MDTIVTKELSQKNHTKFTEEFSKEIYEQTYKYGNETINDTFQRVADNLAFIEKDKKYWSEKFYEILTDFKFVPGGRIISNAGTGLKGTTYINCYVDGFIGEDQDSMEGILSTLRRQALILKSEGGYGFCADVMRPRGAFINGIANETPGAVRMLDMWDTQSAVITEGSGKKSTKEKSKQKIRKGAQMVTLSCWHPDIEEFIIAKQTSGRLTKFNMSCLITDEFMSTVENNLGWKLEFPDYEKHVNEYKKYWDGNLKKWKSLGYSTKIYKEYTNANELWNLIMNSTYNRNEPGVLFVDTINKLNNLAYCEHISASNPCGEQVLPTGGVCLLGSLNLTQFVDLKKKDWNYEKLSEVIPVAIRLMDNVNDLTYVPLDIEKENLINKRRIGLGVMGYGSSLMMIKVKYGSDKALKLTEKLMNHIANTAYQASAHLAKEKGNFILYDQKKYLESNFIKNALSTETIELIKKYGIRNSHLLSIQPTGNSSILANNVSGGLEPIFLPQYLRTSIFPFPPEGLEIPKNIDWLNKKFECENTKWTWIKEGDENLLKTEFNGYTWKFDKSRGLLRETQISDYAVKYLQTKNEWDNSADWASTTTTLSIDDHINTMEVFAKYIDSAMSKTVNIANSYPYEDFKKLYLKLYKTGVVKGCTTYRAGTMTSVLSDTKSNNKEVHKIIKNNAPKRPKTLPCDIHHVTADGQKWIVIVGLFGSDPYEVFSVRAKAIHLSTKHKSGKLIKIKRGVYDLELPNELLIENIRENFTSGTQEALTRLISTALRHGSSVEFIVEQLSKSEGTIVSFSKAIARTLKSYITNGVQSTDKKCTECGAENSIKYENGCKSCSQCGWTACG